MTVLVFVPIFVFVLVFVFVFAFVLVLVLVLVLQQAATYSIAAVAGNWTILVVSIDSVCPFVTLLQIASFLFVDEIESFLAVSSPCGTLQNFFLHFWFRLHNAQNLLSKICTKSPISRLVWQIDRRCLRLPRGFRGWPIQWNHAKCCGPTLVAMATKLRLGLSVCLSVPSSELSLDFVETLHRSFEPKIRSNSCGVKIWSSLPHCA